MKSHTKISDLKDDSIVKIGNTEIKGYINRMECDDTFLKKKYNLE